MFTNISYNSKSTNTKNVDMFSVKSTHAWVLDGANGLFSSHISDAVSDAHWFVDQLSTYLKHNLDQHVDLSEIMEEAMITSHLAFQKFPGYETLCDMNMPSAACAILKVENRKLQYFILGNCEVIVHFKDGNIINLADMRLQVLDGKLLKIVEKARHKKRMPLYQVKNFMNQMLVENRLRRNVKDGFYIVGEDEIAASHAITGVIPIDNIKQIYMMCNGFAQYYNHERVLKNLDVYLEKTRNAKLIKNYNYLLQQQSDDNHLARSIQNELSEQSTMICFDVDSSFHIGLKNRKRKP